MELKSLLFSVSIIFVYISYSQHIRVVNYSNNKPVSNVFIYHENKNNVAYTDEKGIGDISSFPSGLIFLQHPSYYLKSLVYLGNDLQVSLKEKIISFEEVVISANKWKQKEENIAQKVISINKKTIDFQNSQTSADLLANTGQVFVQKSQLGGGSPKIRGFAANSVLLVVDGIRMNNAIFRSGNLQNIINIDANALERSEVIFGPGSVTYGSDALGGVMGFYTIEPRWSPDMTTISVNSLTRYSTVANERTGHLDFSVAKNKFTFFHSSSFTILNDLKAGSWRAGGYKGEFKRNFFVQRINGSDMLIKNPDLDVQKFSGYHLFNTISKIKYRLNDNADISYGYYYSTTSDIPRYDNLTETIRSDSDSLAVAEWYYGPQKWQMHNLKLNVYQFNSLFDQAKFTLAYQNFEESRNDRNFGDNQLRIRTEKVDMYSVALDFDKAFTQSNLYYGIDFYHNDIASKAFRRNIETNEITSTSSRYPDGGSDYTSFALYGNYVNRLTDKIVFNGGLRFNNISLKAKTTDTLARFNNASEIDLNNSAINGALGLIIHPNNENIISYNISTGFRSPNVDDVGKIFDVSNSLIVPNPNLKPEYSLSYELAYQRKKEQSLLRIVAFHSRLFNAIIDGPFTLNSKSTITINQETLDIFAKLNTGDAEIYGASFLYEVKIGQKWSIYNTISYTGGRDISNDEPLRHTTPIFGRTAITYQQRKLRSEFYIDFNGNRAKSNIPSAEIDRKPHLYTDSGTPGWYTLNLKSSYQATKYLNVNIGVENMLNTHYRPYSSGISAPGRNFLLVLRVNI